MIDCINVIIVPTKVIVLLVLHDLNSACMRISFYIWKGPLQLLEINSLFFIITYWSKQVAVQVQYIQNKTRRWAFIRVISLLALKDTKWPIIRIGFIAFLLDLLNPIELLFRIQHFDFVTSICCNKDHDDLLNNNDLQQCQYFSPHNQWIRVLTLTAYTTRWSQVQCMHMSNFFDDHPNMVISWQNLSPIVCEIINCISIRNGRGKFLVTNYKVLK